ncbi:MAG: DNA translocase FtsK 4TM domain-containing protein [Planctomycetota bacterium]
MSARSREVVALALCGFCMYALLCLATFHAANLDAAIPTGHGRNLGGTFGYYLAGGFTYVLGYAAWVPFLALLGYAMALFLDRQIERVLLKAVAALVFAAMLALLLADPAGPSAGTGYTAMTPQGPGGAFGANLSPRLYESFGGPGRLLLLVFGGLVALLIATEWMFSHLLVRTAAGASRLWNGLRRRPAMAGADGVSLLDDAEDGDAEPALAHKTRRRKAKGDAGRAAAVADGGLDDDELAAIAGAEDDGDAEAGEAEGEGGDDEAPRRRRGRKGRGRARAAPEDGDDGADADDRRAASDADDDEAPAAAAAPAPAPAPEPPKILVPPPRPKIVRPKPKPRPRRTGQSDLPFDEAYPFPPFELFKEAEVGDVGETSEELQKGGEAIVQKLGSFGIEANVVAASIGPAVTQYELRLGEGIRVNRIAGFEADLAAALLAVSVRVVAPIPGKDTIGIEVPNPERQKVFMRDLLEQFGRSEDLAIPLYLGKDVAGNPIVEDLARMPHLLIAGTTGSGKSVCINAILLSILMTRTPQQVKLILVDPKMVELQAYKQVPHLCCDVVTNMKKAPSVLQWAVDEMENRYTMLSAAGVNHIKSYNRLGQQELDKRLKREVEPDRVHLPYIVIVIDEFADLMNVAANEVEESIQRLAQKSRAVGMHVIVATQRPSSEVITGIIKANLPCQIAFKVNRRIDSRVILDSNGAEKLLGHGDMLYVPPGGGAMLRAQGAFVADEEMHGVVRYLEEQGQQPNFLPELVQTQSSQHKGMADRDALYREAVEVILGQQRGSATLLQRALSVGYTRATRLLEMMEEDGLVGPFVGSKSREVMMTLDEYKAREAAIAEELAALDAGEDPDGAYEADGDDAEGGVDGDEDAEAASVGAADGDDTEDPSADEAPEEDR